MIKLCRKAGLLAPDFEQHGNQFVLTIWLDRMTEKKQAGLNLNGRQTVAVRYVKENNQISNQIYQEINSTTKRTASRDLAECQLFLGSELCF